MNKTYRVINTSGTVIRSFGIREAARAYKRTRKNPSAFRIFSSRTGTVVR